MLYKTEEDFAKAVKEKQPEGVILLYGSESYLVDAWRRKLIAPFQEGGGFNLQRIDGRKLDCDQLYDATETLPLMALEKCVVVEDLDLAKLPGGEQEKLWEILGDVAPGCTLIVTTKPPLFDPKTAPAKKLIKLAGEAGQAVELGSRGQGGQTAFLKTLAKRGGCELSTDVARYIVQTCETDMHSLATEMEKFCALAGEGAAITREIVDRVGIPRTEARVFDLSKAILAGNPQRALELLDDLFYLREQPIAILSVLSGAYVDLYRARVARDNGVPQGDVVSRFGYRGREFRVRNAFSSRLSAGQVRSSLEVLCRCDRALKSTGMDDRVLLERAVVELVAIRGE